MCLWQNPEYIRVVYREPHSTHLLKKILSYLSIRNTQNLLLRFYISSPRLIGLS